MINFANLRLPRLSLRLFLSILFVLVILTLLIEGGYYFLIQRKKETGPITADWANLTKGQIIEGEINEIKGRTLIVTVENNSLIPEKVEIEVASDAFIFTGDELEDIMPIPFSELRPGDMVQAAILTKLAEMKFKAETISK